jgi:hypothetical protein
MHAQGAKEMKRILTVMLFACTAFGQQLITINGVPNQTVVLPNPTSSALGGVESIVQTTNNWVQYIDTSGVPHLAQPAFSNLNGSLTCGQTPAFSGGDATSSAGSCNLAVGSIGGKAVTLGGALTFSGGFGTTLTVTGTTSVTLPTAGTLAILGKNTFTGTQTFAVNTVASGATPAFDLSLGNVQYVSALATNASPAFSNITAGGTWEFVVCNNGTGGFTWTWPASVHGGIVIGTTASKCSSQRFTSPDGTTLYADGPGVINQ